MELLRALAAFTEPPGPEHGRLADLLELGGVPDRAEHTELFGMQLYPYASVYLGAEGRLGGEARDRIAGFWRALDATPPPEPDHLAVLLAAYASLVEREAEGGDVEGWRRARHAFFWEHLASWLPAYLDRVGELAPGPYACWAALLRDVLEEEAELLGGPGAVAAHLRDTAPLGLGVSRRAGAGEPAGAGDNRAPEPAMGLDGLFAPARTGVIITRRDLWDAAWSTGLGVRLGERRFILETLLGQDPEGVLLRLAELAERQVAAHRTAPAALAAAREPWARRAEACATALHEVRAELGSALEKEVTHA